MQRYCLYAAAVAAFAFPQLILTAAPGRFTSTANAQAVDTRQLYDHLATLRMGQSNHEMELRQFEERFENLEVIIEHLRKQLQDGSKGHKELLQNSTSNFAMKINEVEHTSRSMVADLQQLKSHANETAVALTQFRQRFTDLENKNSQQALHLEHLQAAIKALMEAMLEKESLESLEPPQVYRVKSGDTLEKIAHTHGTSVRALKELNHLPASNDRIIINQKLKLPDK